MSDSAHSLKGPVFASLSSICSSVGTIFYAVAIVSIGPIPCQAVSTLFGAFILLVFSRLRGKVFHFSKTEVFSRSMLIYTFLRPFLGGMLFTISLSFTKSINVIFLSKAEPYFVLFWFWLFERQTVSRSEVKYLIVHVLGAIMLSLGAKFEFSITQFGDMIILLAVCLTSLSYYYGHKSSMKTGALSAALISQFIAGTALMLMALFFEIPNPSVAPKAWAYLLFAGFLYNVIAIPFWMRALHLSPSWLVSALRAIGPIFAAPIAVIFFDETLDWVQVLGALLVLSTSAGLVKSQSKQ